MHLNFPFNQINTDNYILRMLYGNLMVTKNQKPVILIIGIIYNKIVIFIIETIHQKMKRKKAKGNSKENHQSQGKIIRKKKKLQNRKKKCQ